MSDIGLISKKMAQIADTPTQAKRAAANAHIDYIDQPDIIIFREDHVIEMNRPEINAVFMKRMKKQSQPARQGRINRIRLAVLSERYAFQRMIVDGGTFDIRYSIH